MDIIPVKISERLLDVNEDYRGMMVVVNGQFRSYNRHEEHKNKLVLSVFAREIEFVEQIRFFWMDMSAKSLFIGKLHWEGKSQTCFWQ